MGQQYRIVCPHCREPLNCSEKLFGRAIACPKCQEPFRIPSTAAFNTPPEPAAKAQPEPAPVRQPPPSVRRDVERPAPSPRPAVTKKPSLPPQVVGRRPKRTVEGDEDLIETELLDDDAENGTSDDFTFNSEDVTERPSKARKQNRKQQAPSGLRKSVYVTVPLGVIVFAFIAFSDVTWLIRQPITLFLLVVGSVFVYLGPCLIASRRGCHNCAAIVSANLLLGWTVVGWALALFCALTFQPAGNKKAAWRRQRPATALGTFVYTCFAFDGRIPRSLFWIHLIAANGLFLSLFALVLPLIDRNRPGPWTLPLLMSGCCLLAHMGLAVQVKRWHDRDWRGYIMLCSSIPFFGIFFSIWALIETGFFPGTPGDNRFGPDPLDRRRRSERNW